ncbi:hypothetical protein GOP47_0009514 [Adiantum capillus-veneris]|uniref:Major facilitator superfamily (MFS) profile domain-containing protein n=1 Tax=Adiantum capillus-veneris TaxID=13818 RepID=A0A9D4UXM9_ADICA|nr:hypothetical protein GOP47_0009514 [Adiantum capillus-veneris]
MNPAVGVEEPLLLPTSSLAHEAADNEETSGPSPLMSSPSPLFRHCLSIDDVLSRWAGEFGLAQFVHFSLASLAWTLEALQTMLMIFADKTPIWACSASASLAGTCSPSSTLCSLDPSLWNWVVSRHQSTVSEWGLICGEDYKIGLVQSAFFIGALLGAGLFGCLSDSRLGRKGTLALVCILNAVTGILTAFSPNYWTYFALRTATGVSAGGLGLSSFVLATESVGPSKRGPVGMSTFYFFSTGIMALSGLALFTSSWRHLCIVASIPSLIYCFLILPFLKESPRWYLVQGRADDAMKVLASIAKWNGKFLPEDVTVAVEQDDQDIENLAQTAEKLGSQDDDFVNLECTQMSQRASGTILDVLRSPSMCARMLIMIFVWLSVALVYYGISLNVSNLGTNLYLSVFLNAVAEMPAFALTAILLEKFGRRYVLMATFLLGALCCMLGAFVPGQQDNSLLYFSSAIQDWGLGASSGSRMRLAYGVVTIFGMAGAYNLLYIYTAELFPTVVRNAALGVASQAAQVGAIVSPMVVVLGKLHPAIPFGIFAIASVIGGLLAFKLPETLHSPLYETLEGMQRAERSEG